MPPPPRALVAVLFVAVPLAAAGACGGASAGGTPEGTVAAYAEALRSGRYEDAYGMMSQAYRRRVPLAEFRQKLTTDAAEASEAAEALARTAGPPEVTAAVPYGDGEEVELVHEDGSWRIAGNIADFYDQSAPRAALRSFVRAMERRRYDVVMRFVPEADREGMTVERMREAWEGEGREEIERLVANLRASLDNPIEIVGDRATMPYGERFTVQFVREDGVWRIEDPD